MQVNPLIMWDTSWINWIQRAEWGKIDMLVDFNISLKKDYGTSEESEVYMCAYK